MVFSAKFLFLWITTELCSIQLFTGEKMSTSWRTARRTNRHSDECSKSESTWSVSKRESSLDIGLAGSKQKRRGASSTSLCILRPYNALFGLSGSGIGPREIANSELTEEAAIRLASHPLQRTGLPWVVFGLVKDRNPVVSWRRYGWFCFQARSKV